MNPTWRVAVFEYKRNVFKKSFIFTLLSVPFLIAFSISMGLFIESTKEVSRPLGIVDHAGVFAKSDLAPETLATWAAGYENPIKFITFTAEEEALQALEGNAIQAYFILQSDYITTRSVELVYQKEPGENAGWQFFDLLQLHLAGGRPAEMAIRVAGGTETFVRSLDGSRVVSTGGPTFGLMMPLFIAMAFMAMMLLGSGYMMSAVAEEKESRTMEILITSISSKQLIGGKIAGIVAISLTMLTTWTLVITAGIFAAMRMGVTWFSDLSMDWRSVLTTLAIALPSYVLATALMTALGSLISTEQEGQSFSTVFVILHMAPLYVSWTFIQQPNSTLAVVLSLLPFTSLATIGMRSLFTIVPTWQVLISVAVQFLCVPGGVWLASRAFRLGMLRYGQRLVWSKLFRAKA